MVLKSNSKFKLKHESMLLRKSKKVTESTQLSELIKEIRNCKTKAEERAIINKEKASIGQQLTVRLCLSLRGSRALY